MSADHLDHESDRVALALDGLARAARATPVRGAPGRGALARRARQRRRRLRAGTALAVVAVVVPVGLGIRAVTVDGQDRSERVTTDPRATEPGETSPTTDPAVLLDPVEGRTVEEPIRPLALGPLAAREAMATAWTGTEMLVWGGGAGGDIDGGTFADGAAYDPAADSWRLMAPAPLAARTRAASVWTGTEMLVWGGSGDASGVGGFLDGAAYDPAADSWRPLAAAPAGTDRSFASAAWVAGHMVVGGGSTPRSEVQDALVYDPDADAWSEVPVGADVVQVVAAGERAAVLSWDPMERRSFAVSWLDPATGAVDAGPVLDVGRDLDEIGGVWTGAELVAMGRGTDDEGYPGGLVASVAPGEGAWRDRRPVPDESRVIWPLRVLGMAEPALLAWTGSDVVAFTSRYDPASGRAASVPVTLSRLGEAGCGYDAAQVWTGSEVIWWGGQRCRGNETGVVQAATGGRVRVPAP